MVAATERDRTALRDLIAAMDNIGRIGEGATFPSQRVTQFSDSIVLSYRVTERSGVFWMLNTTALTVITLAGRNYFTPRRGHDRRPPPHSTTRSRAGNGAGP